MNRWWRLLAAGALALGTSLAALQASAAEGDFLEPEAAFPLRVDAADPHRLALRFDVPAGYYLYRDRLHVSVSPAEAQAGPVEVPHGHVKFDPNFNKNVETLHDTVVLQVPVKTGQPIALEVQSQGCAEKGLCYPPLQRAFSLVPAAGGTWQVSAVSPEALAAAGISAQSTPAGATAGAAAAPVAPQPAAAADEPGQFAGALQSRSLWRVAAVFGIAGLLLSFTPCVLPMIPILSSIIVGQSGGSSRARGFSLALAYSLGMALVYTAFGMVAGLLGEGLAGALQNAWVLGAFALLLVALSLSMFGVYQLQMPNALQSRLTQVSGRLRGGQHAGVFVMGGLSALIVGPCVAAPLAGALVYISQTRDVAIGGVALFSLACGMSVPLLLVGLSAGPLLPRAGGWMEHVKHFFGILLLGVALWMVSPVLPPVALMLLLVGALLGLGAYLGAFEKLPEGAGFLRHAGKGAGLMLGLMAALEMAGVASGGREPLQPLRHLSLGGAAAQSQPGAGSGESLKFNTVSGLQALEQAVQSSARPVMVDVYADWCVSCKELETMTFGDRAVRDRLAGLTLLRVDVTASSAEDKALMKRYGLFGPPALLFFEPRRGELTEARVVGYQPPERFLQTLQRVQQAVR